MIRPLLLLVGLACGVAISAMAQTVVPSSSCAIAGAYNAVAPTCTSGRFCRVQVDVNGKLKVGP